MVQNEATKTRSQDLAFIADADFLRRVEETLSELKGTLEYNVHFSDGSTVKFSKVEDIINQPNSADRRIVSVIAGVESKSGHSAYLTMRHTPPTSIEYTVTGPQRDVIYFSAKLDELVAASRQWYSVLYSSGAGLVFAIGAAVAPIISVKYLCQRFFPGVLSANGKEPAAWLVFLILILLFALEYYIFKLFPRGTFAIGHGLKRHNSLAAFRIGVVAAFVIGILAEWVMRYF